VIPVQGWRKVYRDFIGRLLSELPIARLTFGGICSYRNAQSIMERKLGKRNAVSDSMQRGRKAADGRMRYDPYLRAEIYQNLIDAARTAAPDIELALCLEERSVWEAVGLAASIGRCNCVL